MAQRLMERAADAMSFVRELQQDFQTRNEMITRSVDIIEMRSPVLVPTAYETTAMKVRTHLPFQQTAAITASLSVNPISVHRDPIGSTDRAQAQANRLERFWEGAWERQNGNVRVLRPFIHSLVVKGSGVLKALPRHQSAWGGYYKSGRAQMADLFGETTKRYVERKRESEYAVWAEKYKQEKNLPFPILVTCPPVESCYFVGSDDGFKAFVEVKDVPYYETLARFGAGLDGAGKVVSAERIAAATGLARPEHEWSAAMGGVRTLRMYEVWLANPAECLYILEGPGDNSPEGGEMVKRLVHRYTEPVTGTLRGPYFHSYGITTSSRDRAYAGVPMLFPYLVTIDLLNSLNTMAHNGVYTFAGWPSLYVDPRPGEGGPMEPGVGSAPDGGEEEGNDDGTFKWKVGTVFPYPVKPVDAPRLGVDLHRMRDATRADLNQALPDVLLGQIGSDTSGYAENQAQHLASLYFDPIVDNAEVAVADLFGWQSWLLANVIGETVYVHSGKPLNKKRGPALGQLGIGPSDLQDDHEYRVKLTPKTPSNDLLQVRRIGEELRLRLMGLPEAREERGRDSSEVEMDVLEDVVKEKLTEVVVTRTVQEIATIDQAEVAGEEGGAVGAAGIGDITGNAGNAFAPGAGMALEPTVGGGPGNPSGIPVAPGTPARHLDLPGSP